jgi:gamma-glutamylcysteine synthetase
MDRLRAFEREAERMDLTGKFAVAVHMAITGKTETLDRMRSDFRSRVEHMFAPERPDAPRELTGAQTLAERYAKERREMQEFLELEKTAVFRVVPDTILNAPPVRQS